ncbi:hypothetical protein MD588_22325 [Photobacterium sp. SDRW27]|uniref:hypothetical protein n=1 Tax=Photobacterium obscurum TaxID=2829490 RepID=UPI0022438241|nr:hypothetical protein [Photobacterium obscurum]MCW8331537.1 hypothetical protein [Photobacterium obscurum]
MLYTKRKNLLEQTLKQVYPAFVMDICADGMFTLLALCESGKLETAVLEGHQGDPELIAFLSLLNATISHMDHWCYLLGGDRGLLDEEQYNNLRYFSALTANLLTYIALYDEDYIEYAISAEDLNRLVAKDITKPTKLLRGKEFHKMSHDDMRAWLSQRRYYKPVHESSSPWKDTPVFDFSVSVSGRRHFGKQQLYTQLRERAVHQGKLADFVPLTIFDRFNEQIEDSAFILALSQGLDLDMEGLVKAVRICIQVDSESATNSTPADDMTSKLEVLKTAGKITSDTVIDTLKLFGIHSHGQYRETKYLKPYAAGPGEGAENLRSGVFVIEKTKTANFWVQAIDARNKLDGLAMTEYPAITPQTTPYGRNSNLQTIDELAYTNVMKFKIKTGADLIMVLKFLSVQ